MATTTLDSLFPDDRPVLLDGAMGSALQARGWPTSKPTVLANLEAPELVENVHREHRSAGARVLTTNTFAAITVSDKSCLESVREGVRIARRAAGGQCKVAGTIAAFGLAVDDPQLDDVVRTLVDEGIDLIVFETCTRLTDAARAMELRRRLAPGIPAVICASTTDGGHADRLRVRAILTYVKDARDPQAEAGLNCCRGPYDTLRLALGAANSTRWVKPSTGVASDRAGDDVMAAFARAAGRNRLRFVGGCCGTTADTLSAMSFALKDAR